MCRMNHSKNIDILNQPMKNLCLNRPSTSLVFNLFIDCSLTSRVSIKTPLLKYTSGGPS